MLNAPNLLSALRLLAAPFLLVLAWRGLGTAFLACFTASLLSDVLDGLLARSLQQRTEIGARLDSWGDLATYAALPFSVWWLWPELIRQEAVFVAVVVVSYVLPTVVGFFKFRRLTSYHTRGAKLSALLMGPALLLLLGWGSPWVFRLAALVLALAELEEIAITAVLPEWRADVPSLRTALRLTRAVAGGRRA